MSHRVEWEWYGVIFLGIVGILFWIFAGAQEVKDSDAREYHMTQDGNGHWLAHHPECPGCKALKTK